MKLRSFMWVVSTIVFATTYPISQVQANEYEIIDIGTLDGPSAVANDINDAGEVTGYSLTLVQERIPPNDYLTAWRNHVFLYDGAMIDLVATVADFFDAYYGEGINDNGHVVGYYWPHMSLFNYAFIFDGVRVLELGTWADGLGSKAYDINNSDQVTGAGILFDTGEYIGHAFVYHDGILHDLGTLGGDKSQGYGINDVGQIVGKSTLPGDAVTHAFFYDGNSMQDLGTLGGTNSSANDINGHGLVTGTSNVSGDIATHAFIYDGGVMRDLGTLGGTNSYGLSINNNGQVVGYSQFTSGEDMDYAAFLYDGNSMLDLCALTECTEHSWDYLESANGINDQGDITGYGYIDGVRRAFLIIADNDDPPIEIEICDDGIDNDGDGRTDCKDKDCRKDPICKITGGGKKP